MEITYFRFRNDAVDFHLAPCIELFPYESETIANLNAEKRHLESIKYFRFVESSERERSLIRVDETWKVNFYVGDLRGWLERKEFWRHFTRMWVRCEVGLFLLVKVHTKLFILVRSEQIVG